MGVESGVGGCAEYLSFRGSVALKRVYLGEGEGAQCWQLYDSGPREAGSPLVCLPPISGTADVFFRQCLALSARGQRVLSVEAPPFWSVTEWCAGFKDLLDYLSIEKVHIFGASLGGFLAQKFAEYTRECPRVASLILCNSFTDTSVFKCSEESAGFWLLPAVVLKKMVMTGLEVRSGDSSVMATSEFLLSRLDSLDQAQLASRLTLNTAPAHVEPQSVNDLPVTIIDVFDDCSLTQDVREETYKYFPEAKLAHLKSGGNFPFLSRSEEVNLHIAIHLRNFDNGI